jgi:putative alpha-1,2-mannosidase
MLKLLIALVLGASVSGSGASIGTCSQYDLVNNFIGTGGFGYGSGAVNPGVQYPHGPLRLGPDTMSTTADIGFQHFAGYYYPDTHIRAFSHTHSVGAGVSDWGSIGLMPLRLHKDGHLPDPDDLSPAGKFVNRFWWSSFNKTSESAAPGYYSVFLDKPAVNVELLAIGTHAGIHKYVWKADPAKGSTILPGLVLDMCHFSSLSEGVLNDVRCSQPSVTIDESGEFFTGSVYVTGSLSRGAWVHIYGEIKTNRPAVTGSNFKEWRMCTGLTADCVKANTAASTTNILYGIGLMGPTHAESDFETQIAVGISFIDLDHAKGNLHASLNGRNNLIAFDLLKANTRAQWCDILSTMDVSPLSTDSEISSMLLSSLYRSHMSPTNYVEYDGQFYATDKQVHNITAERLALYGEHLAESPLSYKFYSDLSFWDTFRTAHPWLLLVDEDIAVGIARSSAEITAMQGAFPRWMMAAVDAGCMIGNSGTSLQQLFCFLSI